MMQAQTVEPLRLVGVRGLLILGGLLTAILLAMVIRPARPSPFTAQGAFGAGYGRQSVMFGANPRAGAPRLR
jgi:hypothetical protein